MNYFSPSEECVCVCVCVNDPGVGGNYDVRKVTMIQGETVDFFFPRETWMEEGIHTAGIKGPYSFSH